MKKEISHTQVLKEILLKYAIKDRFIRNRAIPVILLIIVSRVLEILAIEYSNQIEKSLKDDVKSAQLKLLVIFILFQASFTFLYEFIGYIFVHPMQNAYRKSACDVFRKYISLSHVTFSHIGSGEIFNTIERKSKAISDILEVSILNVLPVVVFFTLALLKLKYDTGYFVPLIMLISFIFYIYGTVVLTMKRNDLRKDINKKINFQSNIMYDSLQNYENVLAYNNRDVEVTRYDKTLRDTGKTYVKLYKTFYVLNFFQTSMFTLQMFVVIYCGINEHFMDKMSASTFLLYISIVRSIASISFKAGYIYSKITRALVDAKLEIPDPEELAGRDQFTFNDKIAVKKLSVYHGDKMILKDVNFEIKKGEKVAIIGKNGTGKSSLLKVLLGYTEYSGEVFIDNLRMRDLSIVSLRNKISYINQDGAMFSDTVRYNIKYGKMNATDQEMYDICKLLHVHKSFLRLKDGYDTDVGERGQFLSGGERQKVAFARAVLKNGEILLLDEPTASLDKESEMKILQKTIEIFDKRTIIMIVHNMMLLPLFDKIVYLEDMTCLEFGSYNDLMSSQGPFSNFIKDGTLINK